MPRRLLRMDIRFNRRLAREISLREQAIGGPVRSRAWLFPTRLLERSRNILLMIHGFNVSLCEAGCAFEKFEHNLNLFWRARAVSLYWPGDTENWLAFSRVHKGGPSRAWAAANYPRQIDRAERSSTLLLDSFRRAILLRSPAQPKLELTIVAHSLGCRLALEFLRRVADEGLQHLLSIRLTVLMAAAVPRYMVGRGGPLARAIDVPDKVIIYKSNSDLVLAGTFRPGQSLEWSLPHGLNVFRRGAIGRAGCGVRSAKIREIAGEQGHSDYWPDENIAADVVDHLEGRFASFDLSRPLELRRRVSGRVMELRVADGRRLSSRPVGRRGLRRVCKSC
jgi:pimeloyl-ACP methyl ester carboxylesterase